MLCCLLDIEKAREMAALLCERNTSCCTTGDRHSKITDKKEVTVCDRDQ